MGEQWRGGDVVRYPGGGQKVNLLRPVLEQWKNQHSTVIMFVDRWEGLACVDRWEGLACVDRWEGLACVAYIHCMWALHRPMYCCSPLSSSPKL